MLDFDVAQARLVEGGKRPQQTENCPLHELTGRVLAQAVTATLDSPPADNSAMDGYAIRHADYQPGKKFPVQQRCFAGQSPEALLPGKTIRLFTGSLLPAGADTVVMQEDTVEADNTLDITHLPPRGQHVRKQGEDVQKGAVLFPAGTLVDAAHVALLASQGYARLPVYARLKVGILTTGDELVVPGQPRRAEQIYNSNGPMLAALLGGLHAQPVHVLHALDTEQSLEKAFATLLADCDLVLTVGGVSVGEKDLVKPVIEKMGGTLDLWRVRMKPGKPVALAHAQGIPIVCLPGNPVSAFVVFSLLVTPLLRVMQGRLQALPAVQYGQLDTTQKFNEKREEFIRVKASYTASGATRLRPFEQQGSGIISSLPWATGFARIPVDTPTGNDDIVRYYDCAHWLR